jgi:hypothetical protein
MPPAYRAHRRARAPLAATLCCTVALRQCNAFVPVQISQAQASSTHVRMASSSQSAAWTVACRRTITAGLAVATAALSITGTPVYADESATESVAAAVAPAKVKATASIDGEIANQFQKATNYGSVGDFDKAYKLYNAVVKYAPGYAYGYR